MECVLKVGVIGLNHKTADLSTLEAVARGANVLAGERALFFPYPTILLSTCNRTEIYFSADNLSEAHAALLALLRYCVDGHFEQRLYSYFHADCFAHLCRVTAGLDSAIFAETEIQRQVKVAYARALEHLALPSCLHYVFQKALKVAKEVRSYLGGGQGAGLCGVLYEIAKSFWEMLEGRKILLVGYSEIHRSFASFLVRKGINQFCLVTRNPETVSLEGAKVYERQLLQSWREFDWISCASKSEEALIRGSSPKRHLIFDLSVPRNVDPAVAKSPYISLWNIEQIHQRIDEQRILQADRLEHCETILWNQVVKLARIYRAKVTRVLVG